jgi:hypothetical protein
MTTFFPMEEGWHEEQQELAGMVDGGCEARREAKTIK